MFSESKIIQNSWKLNYHRNIFNIYGGNLQVYKVKNQAFVERTTLFSATCYLYILCGTAVYRNKQYAIKMDTYFNNMLD